MEEIEIIKQKNVVVHSWIDSETWEEISQTNMDKSFYIIAPYSDDLINLLNTSDEFRINLDSNHKIHEFNYSTKQHKIDTRVTRYSNNLKRKLENHNQLKRKKQKTEHAPFALGDKVIFTKISISGIRILGLAMNFLMIGQDRLQYTT